MSNKDVPNQEKISAIKLLYEQYQIKELVQSQIELHLSDFEKTISAINSSRATNMLDFVNSLAHRSV